MTPMNYINAKKPGFWFVQFTVPHYGWNRYIKFNRPIGRVYHADGSITENVIYALIGRNSDGTIKYAYPIVTAKINKK